MISNHNIIQQAEQYVKELLGKDSSGHDWWHIHRVRNVSRQIAEKEGANEFICELAALLHDVADEKLNDSKEAGMSKVQNWLEASGSDAATNQHILQIIATMSYNGGHSSPMETLEGRVVQDADRLDALGAIGIGRTFAYGGWKGRLMYNPDQAPRESMSQEEYRNEDGTAINHFYEKLLKLKDLMNTDYGKKLAEQRHQYMLEFLEQFYGEWDSTR